MGHSNFCKGCGLEAIIRFYLIFTILFLWLVGCFHFVGLSVVVWGWGLLLFVLFVLGFVSFIVVFFLCCCCWLLIALGFFFSRSLQGWGSILIRSALWSTVYILVLYTTFYPLFCWCWYCCILILCVEIGTNVWVSVPDTMTYVAVTYVCLSRLAWMCEWVYTMTHCMSYNLSTCQYSCFVFSYGSGGWEVPSSSPRVYADDLAELYFYYRRRWR